jgi:hypothetical protein
LHHQDTSGSSKGSLIRPDTKSALAVPTLFSSPLAAVRLAMRALPTAGLPLNKPVTGIQHWLPHQPLETYVTPTTSSSDALQDPAVLRAAQPPVPDMGHTAVIDAGTVNSALNLKKNRRDAPLDTKPPKYEMTSPTLSFFLSLALLPLCCLHTLYSMKLYVVFGQVTSKPCIR